MSLLDTAKDWSLFCEALGGACNFGEKEFKRLTMPERLRRLVAVMGEEALVAEINATLRRLKVGYIEGSDGLDCTIQRHGGATLGWCPSPYDDPKFLPVNPVRFLPGLIRLEERIKEGPEKPSYWDLHKKVRRLCTRTR